LDNLSGRLWNKFKRSTVAAVRSGSVRERAVSAEIAMCLATSAYPLRLPTAVAVPGESTMAQSSSARRKAPEKLPAPARLAIMLHVNGVARKLTVAPWTTLLDALRLHLDLTGTKKGCDHGQCGACTVLVDGRRINSCLTLAVMKDGAQVTTIEGLAHADALHPLQQAFIEHDAFQCGYCTPGQICSAVGLIAEGRAHTADEIRELMSGNICRCGAYTKIVAAIEEVMRGNAPQKSGEAGR
jgi:xanthine dehydrogenase YagT iron-sulfur-binding subunit